MKMKKKNGQKKMDLVVSSTTSSIFLELKKYYMEYYLQS